MNLGKAIRLNRPFAHPSSCFCSVAADHFVGYHEGMPDGLQNPPATIEAVVVFKAFIHDFRTPEQAMKVAGLK